MLNEMDCAERRIGIFFFKLFSAFKTSIHKWEPESTHVLKQSTIVQ